MRIIRLALILLFLALFIFSGLGASRSWWKRGTAHSLYEQLDTATLNIAIYEAVFEGRGNKEEVLALAKALESRRKLLLKETLDPIEDNILTDPIYCAAGMAPAIVEGIGLPFQWLLRQCQQVSAMIKFSKRKIMGQLSTRQKTCESLWIDVLYAYGERGTYTTIWFNLGNNWNCRRLWLEKHSETFNNFDSFVVSMGHDLLGHSRTNGFFSTNIIFSSISKHIHYLVHYWNTCWLLYNSCCVIHAAFFL